ncbi:MAG TPA: YDG domain-containing protein, partial [Bacillota bacterium]|nr:YDG domain-containing protein [Bacillota bacterium]
IIDGAQLSGVVDGDSVTLGDHTMGVFAQAKVGTGIGVITYMTITGDDVENYTIAQPVLTADITTKELTIINAAAQNKIYDGTDNAVIGGAQLSGVVDGDSVTLGNHTVGTFAQAAIGTGIGVTTNMTITGDDADNYTIAQPVLSANITAKGLTVINAAAQDKVYDGTADADIINAELSGVVDGDDVTLGNHTVGTFAQATIGTDIGVTTNMTITGDDAGNYTIAQPVLATANITAKELTVINAEAQDKVYDGTADADIINAELSGVVDGDSVTLENNDAGTFAQATVGTGIEVTTNMTITGDDAGNYTIAQPVLSADITAKELTIGGTFTAEDKIYDGNTTVVIDDSDLTLTGVVDGDSVVLNAAAAFADANAADYIVVSLTDASSISGEDSGNYSLSLLGAPTTTADITPPPSDSKAITDFSLEAFEPDIQAVIDEGAKTITMEVPFGTDVTALVPTIEHTGADIIPASGVVQDFTNPVTYEVTAENNTTAVYTVTMSVALPSNEACLTNLVISSGILNPAFVPDIQAYTADVANSTADITVTSTAAHPGASIEVNMTAVVSGEASQAIALNVGVNTINIIVTAEDGTERIYEVTVNRASSDSDNDDDRDNDDDNDRNTSISEPEPTTSSNITINVNGNSITSAASVDSETGTVTAVLNESAINNALTESQDDGQGVDTVDIKIPKTTGANYYVTELPATVLTGNNTTRIEINSELGTITLPGNMLGDEGAYGIDNVGLSIGTVDKSAIDEKVRTQIGDKPVIELKLKSKEGTISWNNPDAPVTVSIPYTPTEKELSDPEHITVWYIDGEGNVIEVPTGRYNPVTGMVTFSTTHFSNYAVVYVTKTFDDLENAAWGKKSIEVLASKGVMKGVSEKEFEPQSNITRADFLYSLIRTLGVEARFDGNFDDISKDDYYYKEIGIAQRMGITKGTGNNKFNPEESITRQDMMVLTERALRMFKRIEAQGAASDLDKFADKSLIADYAVNSVASVVKEGLIVGSGDGVNPLGNTTRAETAVFLYRIYNK